MKNSLSFLFLLLGASYLSAQTPVFQEITTGAGYNKQSYFSLTTGEEKTSTNASWDIAFSVFGQQDAGIFINESTGSISGQPQPALQVFDAKTTTFSETPNPAVFEEFPLNNAEKNWNFGAFNETRNPADFFDYGWGKYTPATFSVTGNKVFVIKLRNDQYIKFFVQSLAGPVYTFKYANLDGSNEITSTINKSQFAGKALAYFSFTTGNVVDVELPGFDLLYCRYNTPLEDTTATGDLIYVVTGILLGPGTQAVKVENVDPATVTGAAYTSGLSPSLNTIGYAWKDFTGAGWYLDPNMVYFVETRDNTLWKIHFIDFEGAATGTAVFEKYNMGSLISTQNPADLGISALTYPNPVKENLYVALEMPSNLPLDGAQMTVTDLSGRVVTQVEMPLRTGLGVYELSAATWQAGMHVLRLRLTDGRSVILGKVVKM